MTEAEGATSEQNLGQMCLMTGVKSFFGLGGVTAGVLVLPLYISVLWGTVYQCQLMPAPEHKHVSEEGTQGSSQRKPEFEKQAAFHSLIHQAETSGGCDLSPPRAFYLATLLTAAVWKRSAVRALSPVSDERRISFWEERKRQKSVWIWIRCPHQGHAGSPSSCLRERISKGHSTSAHLFIPHYLKWCVWSYLHTFLLPWNRFQS